MSLDYFAHAEVDLAVIETGLGGRLDATNALTPLLTLTTDISRDHVEILGRSLKKLAWEKGGIIKPGVLHLSAKLPTEAKLVIKDICRKRQAACYTLSSNDYTIKKSGQRLDYHSKKLTVANLKPGMPGEHQLKNAALAVKAIDILRQNYTISVSKKAIKHGLAQAEWPGRFQIIDRPELPLIILDVCHNEGSVAAFVKTFKSLYPGRKTRMITGFVKRKPHQKMFDHFAQVTEEYALVPLATKRTVDVGELIEQTRWRKIPYTRYARLSTAYNKMLKTSRPNDIISIVGSHFLVGEFLELNGW